MCSLLTLDSHRAADPGDVGLDVARRAQRRRICQRQLTAAVAGRGELQSQEQAGAVDAFDPTQPTDADQEAPLAPLVDQELGIDLAVLTQETSVAR